MALITDLDDRTLVERHRAGDPDAFRRIVVRHHSSLYANALRRLNDPVAAEDAVQDAFLRAFRNIDGFDGDYHLDAWLHRIVTNTCHDIGRRRGRDIRLFARACTEVEVEAAPADEAMNAVPREQISEALDSLPESYREVLVMRFVDELPYADVAEKAGISEENARARVSRGRNMLKRMLTSTTALIVWAVPPLRRQTQLGGGGGGEVANQAASQVHGLATIAASAPAPATQAISQFSGFIANAGPAIATAAPAVSSTAPTLGKAAVAVGIAASVAIPTGVAVDRARQKPVAPVAEAVVEDSVVAAPGAPVIVEPPKTTTAPSSTVPEVQSVESVSVGDAQITAADVGTTSTTVATTDTTPTSTSTPVAPAEEEPTSPAPSSGPAPSAPPPATEEPAPEPAPAPATDPGTLSAELQVIAQGPRLELSGPVAIAVGDRTFNGHLSGKLAIGPADEKNPQAPRQVEPSRLLIELDDGTVLELQVSGTTTVTQQGQGDLHELDLAYRLIGGADLGLAEYGTTTGSLDVRHEAGTLSVGLLAADSDPST